MTLPFGMATGSFEAERGDWPACVARAAEEGWKLLELTAIFEAELDRLGPYLAQAGKLAGFDRVSLHAPVRFDTSPAEALRKIPPGLDAILHPDVYDDASLLDSRAVFENMDVAKQFGRTRADLETVFERHPGAGFCLDVAHVWTNDPTLALGHELLDAFGSRLRQLHVSGIEPDGTHRPTTDADLSLYEPLLDRCGQVPWLLEAVLAPSA